MGATFKLRYCAAAKKPQSCGWLSASFQPAFNIRHLPFGKFFCLPFFPVRK
jgi:hypothetical protein